MFISSIVLSLRAGRKEGAGGMWRSPAFGNFSFFDSKTRTSCIFGVYWRWIYRMKTILALWCTNLGYWEVVHRCPPLAWKTDLRPYSESSQNEEFRKGVLLQFNISINSFVYRDQLLQESKKLIKSLRNENFRAKQLVLWYSPLMTRFDGKYDYCDQTILGQYVSFRKWNKTRDDIGVCVPSQYEAAVMTVQMSIHRKSII